MGKHISPETAMQLLLRLEEAQGLVAEAASFLHTANLRHTANRLREWNSQKCRLVINQARKEVPHG